MCAHKDDTHDSSVVDFSFAKAEIDRERENQVMEQLAQGDPFFDDGLGRRKRARRILTE
jgi:hypothetical protein